MLPAKQECPADRLIEMIPHVMETAERIVSELSADGKRSRGRCGCGGSARTSRTGTEGASLKHDAEYDGHEEGAE